MRIPIPAKFMHQEMGGPPVICLLIVCFNATSPGAFGKVIKVEHKKTKQIYAIKEINKKNLKDNNMVEQVSNEVKIMYSLNHQNILKLYNHFEDDTNIYLILEFAQGVCTTQ